MVKKKKDFGENDKKTAARDRKAVTERDKKERDAREKEDQYWTDAGEGVKTKAQIKREEQERQRQEALAKKQELKELAKAEEESLASSKKPKARPSVSKITQREILMIKEKEAAELEAGMKERQKIERKEVDEEAYARMVEVQNINRDEGDIEARNVTDAIVALQKLNPNGEIDVPEDMHPEKRRKAAFKKFYERELGELKEDKPGLKLSQYKDIIFKRWLKSPENPMNTDK